MKRFGKVIKIIGFLSIVCLANISKVAGQFNCIDILNGKDKLTIPFEYVEGFIVIEIGLNNALPLHFIFDTGAENTILLEKFYAKLMGLSLTEKVKIIGSDNSSVSLGYISRRVPLSFKVGGPFIADILVLDEESIDFNNIIGRQIDGILGGNILTGSVVEIDYKKQQLTFYNSEKFNKPKRFHEEKIEIFNQRPFINAKVAISNETNSELKLLMDTGAGLHFLLDELSHPGISMPDSVIDGRIGDGLGGKLGGFLGNVEDFNILNDSYQNIPVYFQRKDSASLAISIANRRNGIIGNIYWQQNVVIIDYAREKLYTKQYRKKKKKFRFNKSGLVVFAVGNSLENYMVQYVAKGSAADLVGLKAGDVILSLNKWPNQFLNLQYINRKLSGKEGDTITIVVKRKGERLKFTFDLKNKKIGI